MKIKNIVIVGIVFLLVEMAALDRASSSSASPAAGSSALAADDNKRPEIRPNGGGYFAVSPSYAARFEGTTVEITGHKDGVADRGPSVRFQLSEVLKGDEILANGADHDTPVQVSRGRIAYTRRSDIEERYDVLGKGIEQSFVLPRRAKSEGDLVITGVLFADRPMGVTLPDGDGGVSVKLGEDGWNLRYGAVTAVDALGKTQRGWLSVGGGQVIITVDGEWLAQAAYPVVIDPLIFIDSGTTNQSRPAVAFNPGWRPGGTTTRPPGYFVAYESVTSGGDKEIMGRILTKDGAQVGTSFNISEDASVGDSNPSVTFKYGKVSDPIQHFLVTWERSDGWIAYRIYDRNGTAVIPVKLLARGKNPDASSSPRDGDCRSTFGCEPYLIAYRFQDKVTVSTTGMALALINPPDGFVLSNSRFEVFDTFVDDASYAPHIAYGHSATTNSDYHILTYRRPSGQVVARKVGSSGKPIYDPYEVSSSSTGAPVVAFSFAASQWAIVWRDQVYNTREGRYYVRLRCQLYSSNDPAGSFVPNGSGVTVAPVGGTTDVAVVPDYAVAGLQSKPETDGLALFRVSYVQGATAAPRKYQVYAQPVRTDNKLGNRITISNSSGSQDNTAVKFAHVKVDLPALIPPDCDGSAAGKRCALWVWEFYYSATDHDIYGYVTSSEY